MFLDFFYLLREQGLPVGTGEWLAFERALASGLEGGKLDGFYHLGRALLVKSEGHYDLYDVAFARFFHGFGLPAEITEALRRWLEQPANTTLLEQLRFVEGDWLLLGANHTLATFGATDAKRDERRIDLLVQIVEAATDPSARWLRQERLSARALPQAFRDLAPLIRAWGIDDDLIRGERMSRARTSTLESLWSAVGARLPAIDALLDEPCLLYTSDAADE